MVLSQITVGAIAVALTSCPATGIELRLDPRPDAAGTIAGATAGALAYLDRAATRHAMSPLHQADLACRQAWRVEGRPRGGVFRRPVLIMCSDYDASGPVSVRLYYDGSWDDSTSKAARIRRELTDSLARFGALTVRDSAPSLLRSR